VFDNEIIKVFVSRETKKLR